MLQGHAFEARLYAENVANNFLPATGVVRQWQVPTNASFFNNSSFVRVDSGVTEGDVVSSLASAWLMSTLASVDDCTHTFEQRIVQTLNTTTW